MEDYAGAKVPFGHIVSIGHDTVFDEDEVRQGGSVSLGAVGCIGHALLVVGIESNAVPGMWIDDCQRTS